MSRKLLAVRVWLTLMVIVSCLPGSPALAQSTAVVRIEPSALSAQVNQTINLSVRVDNIIDLTGFELHLAFNPSVLEVLQMTNGGFVASDFIAQNTFDNTSGTLDYGAAQMNRPPAQGSGVLLNITFRARANGNSSVNLRATQAAPSGLVLSDTNGVAIQASWISGSVTVNAPASPTLVVTSTSVSTNTPIVVSPTATTVRTSTPIVTLPSATPTVSSTPPVILPTATVTNTTTPSLTPLPGAAIVRVEPATKSVQVNESFNLLIKAENVVNLTAVELHLAFNPSVLEVIEVTNGGFVIADYDLQNSFDNIAGTLDYAAAQINRSPAQGSGVLINIVFRAKAAGTSNLILRATPAVPSGFLLSGLGGTALLASWLSGSVNISAGPTPTFTNTPTITVPPSVTPLSGVVGMRIEPSTASVQVGQGFNLAVKVDNATNLTAIELHLAFNPNVLEVIQVTNGGFVVADYGLQNSFDNASGILDYAVAQINRAPAQGSGTLLNIAFRAKSVGNSNVTLRATPAVPNGYLLSGLNGVAIPATWANGSVNVVVAPSVVPPSYILGMHSVRWGEYLYCIGHAYGVSPWAIADENDIWWPYLIFPYQELRIPNVPWVNMPAGQVCARQFSASTTILAPTVTAIPVTVMPTAIGATAPPATVSPVPNTATTAPVQVCRGYYTVRAGDTLYRIATMYGLNYTVVANANHLANPRLIYAGQQLCIP